MKRKVLMAVCIWAPAAFAQVGLPTVRLPALPQLPVTQQISHAVPAGNGALNPPELRDLRRRRILGLIRANGTVLERDPKGEPIIRNEVLVLAPLEQALAAARHAGFAVIREYGLESLDTHIVVLRAPQGVSTARALKELQALDPQGLYDFNHVYMDSGGFLAEAQSSEDMKRSDLSSSAGSRTKKLGLIDGGVATSHAVFHDVTVHEHGCADKPVPSAHGTAVASLMVGSSDKFHGAAAGAELYAADVYCGLPGGGAVDAVADAFAWLAQEEVPVINVSLVGPPNLMLENIVRRVIARGQIIVAAVGNDGPAAPPLYPASYPGVVGVTAVDRRDRVLPEAARGNQVQFAAPGADMVAASETRTFAAVRGTSFAAPIVAGLLATLSPALNKAAADEAVAALIQTATDLGAPGRDPVYGSGLVGDSLRPPASLAALAEK